MRVAACLFLQACLLLFRLDLLPVWGDEQFTLDVCLGPLAEIAPRVAADNHPPGYYVLVWLWLRLVPVADPLLSARLLSALIMCGAAWLLWRAFLVRMPDQAAARWVLLLWALSPFASLYGRMARSYGLQLLLFLIVVREAEKALESRRFTRVALMTAMTLYVHYVPGFCALAVLSATLLAARRWKETLTFVSITGVLYAPWAATALGTANRELAKDLYLVLEGSLAEHLPRLGYTWVAWHFGETLALPVVAASLPLSALWAAVAWTAARRHPRCALALAGAAFTGYFFVSRVVIFSLVPARLMFLAPFYGMLIASARLRFPRATLWAALAMVPLYGLAIANYFDKSHFLNKGYLIPFDEVAARWRDAGGGTVLIDITSVDTRPVWPRIPPAMRAGAVDGPGSLDIVRAADPVVFHVRGPRDRSYGRWNDIVDRELSRTRVCSTEGFTPYDRYDHWMMDLLGWPEKPGHMLQLVTCRH